MIKPVRWTTRLELLSQESVAAIHHASLRILERTGLVMPLTPERQDQAVDLGLRVERGTNRVRFPPEVVAAALQKAPRQYTMCARDPRNDFPLDGLHGYLSLDGCGTQVLDLETGMARNSTKADLQAAARLADALPQISFLWPAISAQDCPPKVQPLHELEALLTSSAKHAQAMTAVTPLTAKGTIEMAAEVAGGRDALRARPVVSAFLCSVSPLSYHGDSLEAAWVYGEAGIPTGFVCMPISCATAPATVAGAAALANAEVLAGITLLQLFYPGTPTFYGACGTMMVLTTGSITSGGPEDFLLQAAACQMARHYGLPAHVGTFSTGATASNWHSGAENALSGAVSQLSGADMMCGAGLMNGARIFSFEQLLLDCELYDMLRGVTQGFDVNADTLALDTIHETGPQNHFLGSPHTLSHMHEVWQPAFIERTSWEDWNARNRPMPGDRARQAAAQFFSPEHGAPARGSRRRREIHSETLRVLAGYEPEPLACADRLREIVSAYERM